MDPISGCDTPTLVFTLEPKEITFLALTLDHPKLYTITSLVLEANIFLANKHTY